VAAQVKAPAWSSVADTLSVAVPVLVTVAVTEMVPPTSTLEVADLVTLTPTSMTVVDAVAVLDTVALSWSVPDTVTVSVTEPGEPGAVYEPVHVVESPGARVVEVHVNGPAWSSVAVMPDSPVSPVFVTVAVTVIAPPTSTLEEADFVTEMAG
jgi:hypothetical protein